MIRTILTIFLCVLATCIAAQQTESAQIQQGAPVNEIRIRVMARSYGDSIVLRWAPDHPVAWSVANRFGYIVSKRFSDENNEYISRVLTPDTLKPWTLERMMEYFHPNDTIAAIAAEVIHGSDFLPAEDLNQQEGFVEGLVRQRELQQTRFAFAMQAAEFSPRVAEAMALRFTDYDVKPGVFYDYLIVAAVPQSMISIIPGTDFLVCSPPEPLSPPEELDVRQTEHGRIELAWTRDLNSAFFVERSTDGGITYRQVNHRPYYSTEPDPSWPDPSGAVEFYYDLLQSYHLFSDTVTAGTTYHYRVRGIDAFSDVTPYTPPVSITPINMQPLAVPAIVDAFTHNDTLVRVAWNMAEEPDLAGFFIEKGPGHEGPWTTLNQVLLPPDTREFIDYQALASRGGFYRVVAQGHSGKSSASFAVRGLVEDFIAPSVPLALNGIVYFDGIVELFWDRSPETDVLGYRVAYANQPDHEFVMVTPRAIGEPYFRDTIPINTLTRKVYYKVLAEDFAGNFSDYSDVLELTRPDIIPPVTPLVIDASQNEETVTITWSPSPSSDVFAYRIFRKQKDNEYWELLHVLMKDEVKGNVVITDKPAPSAIAWEYVIEVVDQYGNFSEPSRPVSFNVRGKAVPEIPINLSARYDEENRQINLEWDCESPFPYYIMLFRAENDSPMMPLTTLVSGKNNFTDKRFRPGTRLAYSIRLQLEDGRQSQPSQIVEVHVP